MTDYNDGKWHGWNGGECPVHFMTRVDFIFESGDRGKSFHAKDLDWGVNTGAFRVTKEYHDPREWWLTICGQYTHAHTSQAAAEVYSAQNRDVATIHVREVLE